MSVKQADVTMLMSLIDIGTRAYAAIKQIKENNPDVYAQIGQQHRDALERAQFALDNAPDVLRDEKG
jgi:hypothetical protein